MSHREQLPVLLRLGNARQRLEALIPRLHEANQRFAEASKPAERLNEMDSQQKREFARNIRAAKHQWDEVIALIDEAIISLESAIAPPQSTDP